MRYGEPHVQFSTQLDVGVAGCGNQRTEDSRSSRYTVENLTDYLAKHRLLCALLLLLDVINMTYSELL